MTNSKDAIRWGLDVFAKGLIFKAISDPNFKKLVRQAIEEKKKEEVENLL